MLITSYSVVKELTQRFNDFIATGNVDSDMERIVMKIVSQFSV